MPKILSEKGHEVYIVLLDYRPRRTALLRRDGMTWISVSAWYGGGIGYAHRVNQLVKDVRPNWVIGFSDTYFGIVAHWVAARHHAACAIDAYDNYESYIPWLKPVHWCWRAAVAKAELVTAAGPNLAEFLGRKREDRPTLVVPMAPDPTGFVSRDREECRRQLGLRLDKKLIGYCGAIYPNRGVDVLFDAYDLLLQDDPDISLVLSGRKHPSIKLHPKALWLGHLPEDQVPALLNSLDIAVVVNQVSTFGSYSYPVKLYEAMSCQIPVVATDTPATRWILQGHPELLAAPNNSRQLCARIRSALALGRVNYGLVPTWDANAMTFEHALNVGGRDRGRGDRDGP